MRVENLYIRNRYDDVAMKDHLSKAKQSDEQQKTSQVLTSDAVSMEISRKGFALAGEMEPFIDTYETTCTLLKGIGHIGSQEMINGDFADILSDNYQSELQKLKENYIGKEYEEQLAILDKAYEDAVKNASVGYVKQLRLLTGDIVIKPQTGISYSSEAEAEKAYMESIKKDENRQLVIDSNLADTIQDNVKNILLQLKNLTPDQQKNDIWGDFMSYTDIKNLGSYLHNGTYNKDNDDISDFSKSLIERYVAARTDN